MQLCHLPVSSASSTTVGKSAHAVQFHYGRPVVSIFFFFPRLISAATDWMSTILLNMAWP